MVSRMTNFWRASNTSNTEKGKHMTIDKSETINELATALAKAQGEIEGAEKDARNPHFNSRFSSLASVRAAFRDALSKNGLSIVQLPEHDDKQVTVTTMLMHASGQFIAGRLSAVPVKHDPQGVGSAVSYLRRYSLMSIIGIAPEDDDDGNAASEPPRQQRKPAARAGTPAPTTAPNLASPPGAAPSSAAIPINEELLAHWKKALDDAENAAEYKAVGRRISEVRPELPLPVRAELSVYYGDHAKKHGIEIKPKGKAPGPCSLCGDKEHGSSVCPNSTADERAQAMRADINGAA